MGWRKPDPEIWGDKDDWKRAADAVAYGAKGIAKSLVGANTTDEERNLDRLADEADRKKHGR